MPYYHSITNFHFHDIVSNGLVTYDFYLYVAELMILGFISLLLTFGQSYISRICIVEKAADIMLPCAVTKTEVVKEPGDGQHKRLQWEEVLVSLSLQRRMLAAGSLPYKCPQVN